MLFAYYYLTVNCNLYKYDIFTPQTVYCKINMILYISIYLQLVFCEVDRICPCHLPVSVYRYSNPDIYTLSLLGHHNGQSISGGQSEAEIVTVIGDMFSSKPGDDAVIRFMKLLLIG